jgi:hypothetical protein
LKNGEASLQRNLIGNELSWACKLETQMRVIMVWHLATSLCEIECKQDNLVMESKHFIVANALSKYCAYLVAFAPRFLPDNSYITEVIFDQVVQEAKDVLNGCNSATSKYEKMMKISAGAGKGDPGENIIKSYEALTLVRHGIRYDTGYDDTSFLEKLGYDTGGVYVFLYIYIYIYLYTFRHKLCLFMVFY